MMEGTPDKMFVYLYTYYQMLAYVICIDKAKVDRTLVLQLL